MKRALNVFSLFLALALITTPVLAGGNVNMALGQRALNESDYDPVDQQPFVGATVDFDVDWPINLAGGLYFSSKDDSISGTDVNASLVEATFGVMKTWEPAGRIRPFVGGGLGIVRVEAEVDGPFSMDEDDTGAGLYSEGGVYWKLTPAFNLGVHGRFMTAPGIELAGESFDTSYFQVGLLAGWAFSNK